MKIFINPLFFIIFVFLFLNTYAHAESKSLCHELLTKIADKKFKTLNISDYCFDDGNCPVNVYELGEKFAKSGIDFKDMQVLYIFNKNTDEDILLKPTNAPLVFMNSEAIESMEEGWVFHVVLKVKDNIYDLNNKATSKGQKTGPYFKQMFDQKIQNNKDLRIREIPFEDYHKDFDINQESKSLS